MDNGKSDHSQWSTVSVIMHAYNKLKITMMSVFMMYYKLTVIKI